MLSALAELFENCKGCANFWGAEEKHNPMILNGLLDLLLATILVNAL